MWYERQKLKNSIKIHYGLTFKGLLFRKRRPKAQENSTFVKFSDVRIC